MTPPHGTVLVVPAFIPIVVILFRFFYLSGLGRLSRLRRLFGLGRLGSRLSLAIRFVGGDFLIPLTVLFLILCNGLGLCFRRCCLSGLGLGLIMARTVARGTFTALAVLASTVTRYSLVILVTYFD